MTQEQLIADVSGVVVLYTFWVSALMPVVLGTFWRWWEPQRGAAAIGWTFVIMDILVALALLPAALRQMFGVPADGLAVEWFTVAVIGLIAPVTVWRAWVLYRVQRGTHRKRWGR